MPRIRADIRLLVLEIDGVLCDGRAWQDAKGRLRRSFSVRDAIALKRWRKGGGKVAILARALCEDIGDVGEGIGAEFFIADCADKPAALSWILKSAGLSLDNVAFFSTDTRDLTLMREAALSITTHAAAEEMKSAAALITKSEAGDGAVAEACVAVARARAQIVKITGTGG